MKETMEAIYFMDNQYDNDAPKYLKQKESSVSKANKKSKHKHQYAECLIKYKWKGDDEIRTCLRSYCLICGKIGDKMDNSIVTDYRKKVSTPVGMLYRFISGKELYDKYHDRLPVFFVKDMWKEKYVKNLFSSESS